MKTNLLLLCVASFMATVARPADTPATSTRIGIYDSRAVAYAYFFTPAAMQHRSDLIARAKAAKAAGNTTEFAPLNAELVALQKRNHLQVFSTAPVDDAIAALQPKLPALLNELQVSRLVSKWDEPGLKNVAPTDQVDVTARLVHELLPNPSPQQSHTLASIQSTEPLPLAEAAKLADEGRM
jgi:hypothetical protein